MFPMIRNVLASRIVPAHPTDLQRLRRRQAAPNSLLDATGEALTLADGAPAGSDSFILQRLFAIRGGYVAHPEIDRQAIYMTWLSAAPLDRAVMFQHFRVTFGGRGLALGVVVAATAADAGDIATQLKRAGFRRARTTPAATAYLWHAALA